jgi:hypothetical protein
MFFLGRPLFLLSRGIHSIINFGILSSGILLTWPYHCTSSKSKINKERIESKKKYVFRMVCYCFRDKFLGKPTGKEKVSCYKKAGFPRARLAVTAKTLPAVWLVTYRQDPERSTILCRFLNPLYKFTVRV